MFSLKKTNQFFVLSNMDSEEERLAVAAIVITVALKRQSSARYTSPGSFDTEDIETGDVQEGEWRSSRNLLESVTVSGRNNSSFDAEEVHVVFCKYFNRVALVV